MGAVDFVTVGCGASAKIAFKLAVEEARYEFGSSGYTGTIAEKDSFVMVSLPKDTEAEEYAYEILDDDCSRFSNKWGPAGCILLDEGEEENTYLFFGFAST